MVQFQYFELQLFQKITNHQFLSKVEIGKNQENIGGLFYYKLKTWKKFRRMSNIMRTVPKSCFSSDTF